MQQAGGGRRCPRIAAPGPQGDPVPIVAIGGITPENGVELLPAGADLLAVIHGVFGQSDIRAAAQAYAALFDGETES